MGGGGREGEAQIYRYLGLEGEAQLYRYLGLEGEAQLYRYLGLEGEAQLYRYLGLERRTVNPVLRIRIRVIFADTRIWILTYS